MARLGRAQRVRAFTAGPNLPLGVRAGQLVGTGGGTGALSVAAVRNLVDNPTFTGTDPMTGAGWSTSGFSLVSGATLDPSSVGSGTIVVGAIDNGANYAPTSQISTFLAGVRYYAQVKISTVFEAVPIEVVLGSTSDDYASVTGTTTSNGSFTTYTVSWVPQADRSASTHGLAVRAKGVPVGTFKWLVVDDALIATADGAFWSGWRVGGKSAANTLTGTGGGTGTFATGRAPTGSVTGTAGGTGTLTGKKGALRALTGSAGGTPALTATGAHSGALTGTAGGSGVLTGSAVGTLSLLPPAGLFGGGGRVGRSHPAGGVVPRGLGATYSIFSRTGSLAGTAGGSGAFSGRKGGIVAVSATAGGTATFADIKGGKGTLTATGGGAGTISAAATPQPGGIAATFLMGGGGRMGRSHPAMGVLPRPVVPLAAVNLNARTGSLAASGGGTGTLTARKGGLSTTATPIPAPPPVFVDIVSVPGIRATAGGSFTYSYSRSATRVGAVTGTAGGTGTFTATKKAAGAVTGSGGGSATLTVRRGASSAITATGGGSFTYSYTRFEARNGSVAASGGGTGTFRATKKALVSLAATGGGSLTPSARKGGTVRLTGTSGGSFTYSYTRGGLAALGTVTGTGGGTGRLVTGKNVTFVSITTTSGGTGAIVHIKGATRTITGTGGGTGRFVRRQPTASALNGRVNPRHRRDGHVSRDELHDLPVLLRR